MQQAIQGAAEPRRSSLQGRVKVGGEAVRKMTWRILVWAIRLLRHVSFRAKPQRIRHQTVYRLVSDWQTPPSPSVTKLRSRGNRLA